MKKPKYFRKDKVIRSIEGDEVFKTVTASKRRSRELQMKEDGELGRGSLAVVQDLSLVVELG